MHRKNNYPRTVIWKFLLAFVVAGLISRGGMGQDMPPKRAALIVPINGTKTISVKENLKTVTNQDPNIARVSPVEGDPRSVQITGLKVGTTRLTLTDIKNVQEVYDVVVQTNVEHLRAILRQAAPTANIQIIPASENTIVLAGTVARVEDIDPIMKTAQSVGGFQVINHLRTGGVSQVQLCVVVARVNRSKLRSMGFNFLTNSKNGILGSTIGAVIPPLSPVGVPSAQLQPTFAGQLINSIPGTANFFVGAIHPDWGFLGFLQALQAETLVKLLAEPRLVTLSGRPASFLSGGEQAVPVPAGLGQVGIQFEEFGTRLNFLPIVMGNGKIHLEVEPEVSTLSQQGSATIAPGGSPVQGRLTQRVHTTVELEDGQTFVIGGLIQHTVEAQTIKFPVLGSLPFIGAAFSTKVFNDQEEELLVMVTPHLVDAMDCLQLPKLLPGQETRSPDDFELFLEGILEAPRGAREVFPGGRYLPAFRNGPTAATFPCMGGNGCNGGNCGAAGCSNGNGPIGSQANGVEMSAIVKPASLKNEQAPTASTGTTAGAPSQEGTQEQAIGATPAPDGTIGSIEKTAPVSVPAYPPGLEEGK